MTKAYYKFRAMPLWYQAAILGALVIALMVATSLFLSGQADAGTAYIWTCRKYPFTQQTNNYYAVVTLMTQGWNCSRYAVWVP